MSWKRRGGLITVAALMSCVCLLADGGRVARAQGSVYTNAFDDPQHSWEVEAGRSGAIELGHRRYAQDVHSGAACEQIVLTTARQGETLTISHDVPDSLVFDELTATLWVKSNLPGLRVGVRVRFPHEVDPRTGEPLVVDLLGEAYSKPLEWQRLSCRTTNDAVQEKVARLQNILRRQPGAAPIDQREMTVERVVLHLESRTGRADILVDDLTFSPIVAPAEQKSNPEPAPFVEPEVERRLVIGDDRLLLDGRPFIPLFTAYHGEQVDALGDAGINVVWIESYDDPVMLGALRDAGLFAMAMPPQPEFNTASLDGDPAAGLLSLAPGTEQILFWNVGTRLPAGNVQPTAAWTDMIREADYVRARPIMADVVGSEREFHRSLDAVGSSRHILHTSNTPREYLDYLLQKRRMALQDKPSFTFVQTEPSTANLTSRPEGQSLPVVEPEQIWLQAYAALAAGYKGIGYWKYSPLTATTPGGDERRLAISLFNAHVSILEPWLATGKLVDLVPATLGPVAQDDDSKQKSPFGLPLERLRPENKKGAAPPSEIMVAVIQCGQDQRLLLPVWYETGAQFQPGPMFASELSFVISNCGDNAQAWEVTTTDVTPLPDRIERVAGGTRIRLSNFDQHTAIVLTWGADKIPALKQHVNSVAERAARDWVDLAAAKVKRVTVVNAELAGTAIPVRDAESVLVQAQRYVDQAEANFRSGRFNEACRYSRAAMQFTRTVQRRHWDNAVSKLTSGVSSPHAICFQTLPDHWRMVAALGKRNGRSENLLRSGDFEDSDTMFASKWEHFQTEDARVRPWAELFGNATQGKYCLRLMAGSADPSRPPVEVLDAPERFISPPIPVYAGQIVHISGRVQVATPLAGNPDGLVIYESIKGTVGALRWKQPVGDTEWQRFDIFREVQQSDELRVTIELRALGDVRIDDLQVVTINPE